MGYDEAETMTLEQATAYYTTINLLRAGAAFDDPEGRGRWLLLPRLDPKEDMTAMTPVERLVYLEKWHEKAAAALNGWFKTYMKVSHNDHLERLKGALQILLDRIGKGANIKTKYGTAHCVTTTSASVFEKDKFMEFVIENEQFDLLERRASMIAVEAFRKKNGTLPPGVNLTRVTKVRVRSPGDTGADDNGDEA